jgi:hypothetical protein
MKKLYVDIGKGGKWELNVSPPESQIQSEFETGVSKTFNILVGDKHWKLDITKEPGTPVALPVALPVTASPKTVEVKPGSNMTRVQFSDILKESNTNIGKFKTRIAGIGKNFTTAIHNTGSKLSDLNTIKDNLVQLKSDITPFENDYKKYYKSLKGFIDTHNFSEESKTVHEKMLSDNKKNRESLISSITNIIENVDTEIEKAEQVNLTTVGGGMKKTKRKSREIYNKRSIKRSKNTSIRKTLRKKKRVKNS